MNRLDEELQGRRRTTISEASMTEEARRSNTAQNVDQLRRKLKKETAREGGGITGWIKAFLHHADRDLAGEYERREDPDAPRNPASYVSRQQQSRGDARR